MTKDRFDLEENSIRGKRHGDGFLEVDHRGDRQTNRRRGGEPLL